VNSHSALAVPAFKRFSNSGLLLLLLLLSAASAVSQQTLGSVNGTVTDSSGAVVPKVAVKVRAPATNLEVTAESKSDGSFSIADLPIGTYEVTFTKDGFQKAIYPEIIVQGNRTATLNAKLKPGKISSSVTVEATPLLNETDTTTGYTLNEQQIAELPLGTGSFTQLAILSPGVSADLLNTAGTNAGLGNQAIWANGQRDTSNNFTVNGVDATNLFNGKSTSQVTSSRVAVNIGESGNSGNNPSGEIITSTSVYGAIGEALPSPPPETIEEMHVNTAMYDASQGANSGAQIGLTTKSGTNAIHGGAYEYHQQTGWNANEWFFNHNQLERPNMHRNVFGAYIGGPIKKDKLFFFGSYQGQRVSDQLLATNYVAVPPDLTDARDANSIATAVNTDFGTTITGNQITPQALALLQAKTSNGSYFIPSASPNFATLQANQNADTVIQGPNSQFTADQVNGNLDFNFSAKDRLAAKYYFQRDPNTTPFAESQLLGFPQTMKAGSSTFSLDNTTALTPNLTWEQRLGFIRQTAFSSTSQSLTPGDAQISLPGLSLFPTINIKYADNAPSTDSLSIGPTDNFANAGIFQNRYEAASNLKWMHGRHSIATGFIYDYTQLNVINKNNDVARITFEDFPGFLLGDVCSPNPGEASCSGQDPSEILNGASNRHYRAKQAGAYVQDGIRLKSNLTFNIGLRWDWDGPLYEENGLLTNFYPQDYSYNAATDSFNNIGLVVAGNNKAFGSKVSNSTITGRQWGFAPRIGIAYSPAFLKNKVVVRAGFGMYYDRGEYFTELSPPAGGGISGPFGVTVEEPFVVPYYAVSSFAQPFGTAAPPPPPANLSSVQALIPNAGQLINEETPYCNSYGEGFCSPLFFGGYDPKNTLPYSENWTLDLQWQPRNDLVISLGYVGNHGVHETIPVPFNQAGIATAQNPTLAGGPNVQIYSYGTQVPGVAAESACTLAVGYCAGNADLRTPYLGYDPNSDFNRAIGMSNYDALQFHVTKRLSHGLSVTGSYTYSHTLDEQSGLGLFYNGNDPNNTRSSYGSSDFDRTHQLTVSYVYQLPSLARAHGFANQAVNGWGISGVTVLQSGQPYSVIDFSGGAASIYWGDGQDYITNPIVPVGGFGATASNPKLQGTTGVNGNNPVLNAAAFGIPTPYTPGTNGVPACDSSSGTLVCDNFENGYAIGGRNIFRAPFQQRWDFDLFKDFKVTERFQLKYDLKVFNLFNHPSFDIPSNDVQFNPGYCYPPSTNQFCAPPFGYQFPPAGHLGTLQHSIGSPRFIQMALHFTF
jgi:hypothetical protein